MKRLIALLAPFLIWGGVTFADADKVQTVIQSQLNAFQVDDFDGAFDFAAPNIRSMFQSADRFEQMVKGGYPMVHRHRSVTFGDYAEEQNFSSQIVNIEAMDGSVYQLRYDLTRSDGLWRIQGVQILGRTSTGA